MVSCSHTLDSHTHVLISTVSEQAPSHQTERSVQSRASPTSAPYNQRAIKEKNNTLAAHTYTHWEHRGHADIVQRTIFKERRLFGHNFRAKRRLKCLSGWRKRYNRHWKKKSFTHSSFWLGTSLAHGGVMSAVKATSSWELEDDWSERWGGRRGGRSSSMITVSSCGMLTVGESW